MSTANTTALFHRWLDAWQQDDIESIDFRSLATADFVRHDPTVGDTHGPDGERELVLMYRAAFPDLAFTVEHVVVEADLIVAHLTARGTHQGELMGIPPTGRSATVAVMDLLRVEDGKVAEQWTVMDALGLMQQLGAVPTPGQETVEA